MAQDTVEKKEGVSTIRDLITSDNAKKQFSLALPKHLTPDRFIRVALTALNKTPKLMACTKNSIIDCLLECSQLGLEPDGRKVHLIPYGDKCTLIIDYKGLVDLAYRSGDIANIHSDVVCANDEFEYSFGTGAKLFHRPSFIDRGKVIAGYSFVQLKDGSTSYDVMNVEEINAIKKRSKAANCGPWITDWNEMAKKTVFRRLSKWLRLSVEYQEAIDKDYDSLPLDLTTKPFVEIPEAIKDVSSTVDDEEKEAGGKTLKVLIEAGKGNGWTKVAIKALIKDRYGTEKESIRDISKDQFDEVLLFLKRSKLAEDVKS